MAIAQNGSENIMMFRIIGWNEMGFYAANGR